MRVDAVTEFTVPAAASVGIYTTTCDGMARYIHDRARVIFLSLYFVVVARENYSLVKNEGRKMDEMKETVSPHATGRASAGPIPLSRVVGSVTERSAVPLVSWFSSTRRYNALFAPHKRQHSACRWRCFLLSNDTF